MAAAAPGQPKPKVVTVDGHARLAMPPGLRQAIEATCPGFRVPQDSEIVGRWARNISESSLPYVTWGDYDGNGLVDVGIVLLREGGWKFIIFNQASTSRYKATYTTGGKRDTPVTAGRAPEGITLTTIPAGKKIDVSGRGGEEMKTFDKDVIELTQLDDQEDVGGSEILHWTGSEYESVDLSGD